MPTSIEREEARSLVDAGAQLVDVLPREEFEELHLAGALSVPLRELDELARSELDRERAVVTYCNDHY